jgi:hypothetical protein
MSDSDLTGTWVANDGGLYYIRQIGTAVWWAGFSTETFTFPGASMLRDFHMGLQYTNAFQGERQGSTILGTLVDAPRGNRASSEQITLTLDETSSRLQRQGSGIGTEPSTWNKTQIDLPSSIAKRFEQVLRNDGNSMGDKLKIYKEHAVVFGWINSEKHFYHESCPPRSENYSYQNFWTYFHQAGNCDGDICFNVLVKWKELEGQIGFWE